MSKENLDQFIQQISDSEELQTRIGEEIDADSLIALGAEHGCEFSAENLAEGVELSDEELDGVAGGLAIYGIRRKKSLELKDPKR
jgi:predicted ribosomally synthesized peptide with nif11-like leader